MSKYTPSIKHTIKFDGDTVTMTLKRLKRQDMVKLNPVMVKVKPDMSEDDAILVADELRIVIPGNVEDFTGLKDEEGNEIPLDTALEEYYFSPLMQQIAWKLVEISTPESIRKEMERKKSKQQSPSTSKT